MTAQYWEPHGLIRDKRLEHPYQDAKQSIDAQGNEISPKEHSTVHLFEDLFNRVLFPEQNFFLNSQVPPASRKGPEKACDLAIKRVSSNYTRELFCFIEAKRAENNTHAKIKDLEKQALRYCKDFQDATNANLIFACTLVGASIRCWSQRRGEKEFKPFWPGKSGQFASYYDVGEESHRNVLEVTFAKMKSIALDGVMPLDMDHADFGVPRMLNTHSSSSDWVPTGTDNIASSSYHQPMDMITDEPGLYDPLSFGSEFLGPVLESQGNIAGSSIGYPLEDEASSPDNDSFALQENEVDVTIPEKGNDVADTLYRLEIPTGHMKKYGREFIAGYVRYNGNVEKCNIYIGKRDRTSWWTRSLDHEHVQEYAKRKGKESARSGKRR